MFFTGNDIYFNTSYYSIQSLHLVHNFKFINFQLNINNLLKMLIFGIGKSSHLTDRYFVGKV